jgi:hypothetical protein
MSHQQGRISDPAAPWAWPTESSFWMFILGKVGRGLALPFDHPYFGLAIVLAVVALVMLLVVLLSNRILQEKSDTPQDFARTATVFLTLVSIMGAYASHACAAWRQVRDHFSRDGDFDAPTGTAFILRDDIV